MCISLVLLTQKHTSITSNELPRSVRTQRQQTKHIKPLALISSVKALLENCAPQSSLRVSVDSARRRKPLPDALEPRDVVLLHGGCLPGVCLFVYAYTRARAPIFARSCLYLLVRFSSPEAVTHSRPPFGLLAFPVNYLCCGLFTQLDLGLNSLVPTLKKRSKTGNGTHADCEGIQAKAST